MRKILAVLGGVVFFFFAFTLAYADENFNTYSTVVYDISSTGKTTVTHNITLENAVTDLYATSYGITINDPNLTNISATYKNHKLQTQLTQDNNKTSITINFDDAVVGKGEKREFGISYSDNSIVTKNGAVWEVLIPQLSKTDKFSDYNVILQVPTSLGNLAYISPNPNSKSVQNGKNIYKFTRSDLAKSAVTAAFGQFQVFSFDITYHLENPLAKNAFTEIALPPDTNYQKVFLDTLDPNPDQVTTDQDGNWIAKYIMTPRQRFDVKAKGSVQIYASPHSTSFADASSLKDSLVSTNYWQTNDPQIKQLAQKLKTPQAIYNYVVKTLKYNYDRVKPNVTRLGALGILNAPDQAICMEYTDLFIALARAAGIPAREINGYAYTENTKLQPLSLVADVLHSWPEYWDEQKGEWIQVDPTWGSTSGIDFFTRMDLRHFAFVIHGRDSDQPYPAGSYKLGANPQKDVYVNFSTKFTPVASNITIKTQSQAFSVFRNNVSDISMVNNGPTSAENVNVDVYFDDKKTQTYTSQDLPPFGHFDFSVQAPYGFLGKNMPEQVVLVSGNQRIVIPTNRQSVIITQVVLILGLILVVLGMILIFVKRQRIIKFFKNFKIHVTLPNFRNIFKRPS